MSKNTHPNRISTYTQLLRQDADILWIKLRELIKRRDLDTDSIFLADFYEDDADYYKGIIVTSDQKIYRFTFNHRGTSPLEGSILQWDELVFPIGASYYHPIEASRYNEIISTALDLIGS
jgi:hypothetical protein